MCGQRAHGRRHAIGGARRQGDAAALRHHVERRALRGREVHVAVGDRADERDLEHLGEPLRTRRGVAEQAVKDRIERTQIQQRLVDVKGNDPRHASHLPAQRQLRNVTPAPEPGHREGPPAAPLSEARRIRSDRRRGGGDAARADRVFDPRQEPAIYCLAIAIRRRSSEEIRWSAASSMSIWTHRTRPVKLLSVPWSSLTGVALSRPRSVVSSPEKSIGTVCSTRPSPTLSPSTYSVTSPPLARPPPSYSVCFRKPAYTSICRASTGLRSSGMLSHAGISSARSV